MGVWETKVREAALAFHSEDRDIEPASTSELLLRDIEHIFGTFSDDKIKTETLLDRLHGIEDGPWLTYSHGKPLDARRLARLLRPHGIKPKTIRFHPGSQGEAKGYYKADFADAWKRYLSTYPATAVTSVTDVPSVTDKAGKVGVVGGSLERCVDIYGQTVLPSWSAGYGDGPVTMDELERGFKQKSGEESSSLSRW
jgi:hypothetical protein